MLNDETLKSASHRLYSNSLLDLVCQPEPTELDQQCLNDREEIEFNNVPTELSIYMSTEEQHATMEALKVSKLLHELVSVYAPSIQKIFITSESIRFSYGNDNKVITIKRK